MLTHKLFAISFDLIQNLLILLDILGEIEICTRGYVADELSFLIFSEVVNQSFDPCKQGTIFSELGD